MKKETLKELGKSFLNIGNGVIIVTIINGLFNFGEKIGSSMAYIIGVILINKGAYDE